MNDEATPTYELPDLPHGYRWKVAKDTFDTETIRIHLQRRGAVRWKKVDSAVFYTFQSRRDWQHTVIQLMEGVIAQNEEGETAGLYPFGVHYGKKKEEL